MKRIAAAVVVLVVVLMIVDAVLGTWFAQIPVGLLFGWVGFLITTLPKMTADWPTVYLGIVSLVLFPLCVHWFARHWQPWSFRWSLGIVSVALLLFISSVAVVGMIHQVGWLLFSGQAVFTTDDSPSPSITARSAIRTQWINNVKQIELSFHSHNDVRNRLPYGGTFTPDGGMLHSWETQLLPYVAYNTGTIKMEIAWNDPINAPHFKGVLREFVYPGSSTRQQWTDDGFGASHLSANSWVLSANKSMNLKNITDGTANTILIGSINSDFPAWGHPVNWRDPAIGLNVKHGFGGPPGSDGVVFGMADGSVRVLNDRVSPDVLRALSTPNGNEPILAGELDALK